jgi:hypothetical protein
MCGCGLKVQIESLPPATDGVFPDIWVVLIVVPDGNAPPECPEDVSVSEVVLPGSVIAHETVLIDVHVSDVWVVRIRGLTEPVECQERAAPIAPWAQ